MMKVRLLAFALLLALVSLVSASTSTAWVPLAFMALTIGACIIGLGYMLAQLFNLNEMKAWVSEELYQLLMTGLLVALITGGLVATDNFLGVDTSKIAGAVGGDTSVGIHPYTLSEAAAKDTELYMEGTMGATAVPPITNLVKYPFSDKAKSASDNLGATSSQSGYCSFLGVGYSITTCSSLNVARGAVANALNASALAIMDYKAQIWLINLGSTVGLTFLLPLGIFFRCFYFTRGAGGVLIAVALSLYIVLPLVAVLNFTIMDKFVADSARSWRPASRMPADLSIACDPFVQNEGATVSLMQSILDPTRLELNISQTIIGALFLTSVNIFATLTAIRALASFLGADIDVASLAKIS